MTEKIIDKVNEDFIKELVKDVVASVIKDEPGKVKPYAKRVIDTFYNSFVAEHSLFINSGGKEESSEIIEISKNRLAEAVEAILKSPEAKDELYKKCYERLKASSETNTTWGDLFTEIYEDEDYLNEIFVRLVEEQEGVEITSAKQLQELTGITELYPEMNKPKEERTKKTTKKEALAEATRQIEQTFTQAMSHRYSSTLERILEAGGTYNDLLKINPKDFNLPETWSGCLASNKESSILWAIFLTFYLGENRTVKPDLRAIAKEIGAPYSVLMDANKLGSF